MADTDVFWALRREDLEQFKHLLAHADINTLTDGERNLLHVAIAYGRVDHARELIHRGIDVNAQDVNGETPLHYAAVHCVPETAQLILEHGGDVSLLDKHGNTPLWCAAFNARGSYETVNLLLQHGAMPTHKNMHGKSPLDFARQIEDKRLIDLLLRE